jgi:hypothetical protein
LKVQSEAEEIHTHQNNWKEHTGRTHDDRLPKLALKHQPVGKQSSGDPKKRWKDQFLEER